MLRPGGLRFHNRVSLYKLRGKRESGAWHTEDDVADGEDDVLVPVDVLTAAQSAVELPASTAAPTSSCAPVSGVVARPQLAAVAFSSGP